MKKFKIGKRFFTSLIALILVVMMAAGITYSWVEGGSKGYLNGNEIFISSGSNLTMKQDGKITDFITIPSCELFETSSADGRNFFFPLGDNTTNDITEMKFREGTPFDVNEKYISIDFQLEADKSNTPVYLGSGTIIQCDNTDVLNALRMSISTNDGTTPIVFKPNQMPGSALMTYAPIVAISDDGTATTADPQVTTQSYGNYYYQGDSQDSGTQPIFTIPGDTTLNITVSIWLEGTLVKSSNVAEEGLDIYLDFTTKASGLIKYTFIDNCRNRDNAQYNFWVDDKGQETDESSKYDTMVYLFDATEERYYAMRKIKDATDTSGAQWQAYIPDTINNFYFRRYSIDIDTWWNEWEPTMTAIPTITNPETNERERTFVAIAGQEKVKGKNLDGCYGYWKDKNGSYRIYFQRELYWNDLHCYAWDSKGNYSDATGPWPGKGMEQATTIDGNKPIYFVEFDESDDIAAVEFNNGKNITTVYFEHNYGENTHAYAYNYGNDNVKYTADWPGNKLVEDDVTGYYKLEFSVSNIDSLSDDNKKFAVIVNNGNGGEGNQLPTSGGYVGDLGGKSYIFKNGEFSLYNNCYQIKRSDNPQYFFNGLLVWYKKDGVGNSGFQVYTHSGKSNIFPVNDPTP